MASFTFTAGRDAKIDADLPDTSFRDTTLVVADPSSGGDTHSVLRFDLGVSSGAVAADFTLNLHAVLASSAPRNMKISRLTQDFVEDEVSWNEYESDEDWSTPGGDFTTSNQVDWDPAGNAGLLQSPDITALVQDAIDNNDGVLLLVLRPDLSTMNLEVHSRETGSGDQVPRLIGGITSQSERLEDLAVADSNAFVADSTAIVHDPLGNTPGIGLMKTAMGAKPIAAGGTP